MTSGINMMWSSIFDFISCELTVAVAAATLATSIGISLISEFHHIYEPEWK